MPILYHPNTDDITLPSVLYALGDPIRLGIVRHIAAADAEVTCGETVRGPVPKSTLSHHLKVLREAGVIRARKQGREYHNALRRAELDARFPGLLDAVLRAPDADE